MKTGIFTYDANLNPDIPGEYKIYLATDPLGNGDLGTMLNEAVRMLVDDGCENVIFIGRGCIAQQDTVKDHLEQLENHLYPLVTCGRVLHRDEDWKDYRELGAARRLNLFNKNGCIIQNASVLTSGYGISLANFGMNRAALDRLNRFTQMYYEHPGPFPVMNSTQPYGYGKVLSLCAWCARVTLFMLPTARLNAVRYDLDGCNPYSVFGCGSESGTEQLSAIHEKMAKKPLDLNFFDSAKDY